MLKFKSTTEEHFYLWVLEAQQNNLIDSWDYEQKTFTVAGKQYYTGPRGKNYTLHQEQTYTPDFYLHLTPLGREVLDKPFREAIYTGNSQYDVWIDTKGAFDPHKRDDRTFQLKRCLLYYFEGIWTVKVVIPKFWKKAWCPAELMRKKNGEPNVNAKRYIGVKEYIARNENRELPF